MTRPDLHPALEFLQVKTPDAWLDAVPENLQVLLIDHANCEKKAASTALSLMYRYVDHTDLLHKMSRLAREELRHFEQVLDLMTAQGVAYNHLSASRYAQELHQLVAKQEPQRLIDTLILGAVVEARSCERFVRLVEVLPADIAQLYQQLVYSEARHFTEYLDLAQKVAGHDIQDRVNMFLTKDAQLITSVDSQFRFHSGVPG
jgi:tRNA 2-(methylsulfanyl)-N6-isopentenyladenosine37 hydroxylase